MKRLVATAGITLLLAGAVTSTAFGFAATFDYAGHVKGDPNAFVGFFLKHGNRHRKVVDFTVAQVPYTCSDAPAGTTAGWKFDRRLRVRKNPTFGGRGDWIEQPFDPVGRVSGKLRRDGVAVGEFKLRGELAGPGTHCHTGRLGWRAMKQEPLV